MLVLAFDFGMRRIGVATGQKVSQTASPLCVLKATDGVPDWEQVAALIKEWRPSELVVGLPLNMDDTEQHLTKCARSFARKLQDKFSIETHLHDERLTTWEAKQISADMNSGKQNRSDAIAAALILQSWLRS